MGIWRTLGQIRIIRVKKNAYCITTGSEKLARKLLEESLWNIKGYCFSVRHWPKYHSLDDIATNRAIFWIQAHGIPLNQITVGNGRKLGNILGSVIECEDPLVAGNRGFLRIRVDFDTSKPLATFVQLPRPGSSPSKIRLKYENLKSFCFNCGRLGHLITSCRHRMHPLLKQMRVVYDHSLVAEPWQKPIFTQTPIPLEFPYAPMPGIFRRGSSHGGPSNSLNSRDPQSSDRDLSQWSTMEKDGSVLSAASNMDGSLSCQVMQRPKYTNQVPSLWNPDAHGAMFRNGSLTRAIGGINLNAER
ncbi:uncharacterized protein LOC133737632 [Rosa rugosa]|uniref:uncharacterized protein LOC133737632 n=1 Tax=Rosa rugosa TaxID=74645 RepID=UPI002B40B0F3|nr:uncharacterized protein LOC133737632 [Rosa rugosa]